MNRLFAASLLVGLIAIQLTAPIGVASESVLVSDPTRVQDTFGFDSERVLQSKKSGKKKSGKKKSSKKKSGKKKSGKKKSGKASVKRH